ncbi:alpha-tocopherol transfer protein-like [Chrysoperla carnea]|uniref:alpha-tocopherol transfer protein-like n=1 Tax=Chrysoperla carnea TaxID=189513 RepID=UPI001D08CD0C|nr:alpha-tocopherol transfer protein-like [Chrysoperla carnea]XP_044732006.1 alpha-tocopherol transfer protein-like [Chrysoperla carnea]
MTSTRKWVTDIDDYKCELPEETIELAKNELREDPDTRDQTLKSLRNWIMQNPRILNCRMDARFLIRFLRSKKFSVVQAQEALERYILLRTTFGIAFNCLDIQIPTMEELVDLGYLFACPQRDSKNRRVIVARPGVFDPLKYSNADMCRIHGIVYETLMEDELNQIHGFVHFADGQGVGFSHLTLFTPKEAIRIVKNGERTLPMRHKEVHAINVHPSVKFALDFGMSLISEKIRKRVKIYTSLDDALKNGMDTTVLPKEYGGTMPMEEMIKIFKKELHETRDTIMSHDLMEVNVEMYSEKAREGAVSALRREVSCGAVGDMMQGVTGNFRKLEVD